MRVRCYRRCKTHPNSRVTSGFCGARGHSGNRGNRCTLLDQNGQCTVARRGRQCTRHNLQKVRAAISAELTQNRRQDHRLLNKRKQNNKHLETVNISKYSLLPSGIHWPSTNLKPLQHFFLQRNQTGEFNTKKPKKS